MMGYAGKLTLRLGVGVGVVVCLCLGVARVIGLLGRPSPILVYAASEYATTEDPYPLVLVDVERNISLKQRLEVANRPEELNCSVNGQVAFSTLVYPQQHIFVTDMLGGNVVQVTHARGIHRLPKWSPDGKQLAYVSGTVRSARKEIVVLDVISGESQTLIQREEVYEAPVWSPDGTQLLFVSYRDLRPNIHVVTLADESIRRLTERNTPEQGPVWSPDGKWVAFVSIQEQDFNIYRVDRDGGNLRQLTQERGSELRPSWTPDGTHLVFFAGLKEQVIIMDADGEKQHNFATILPNSSPLWSADGRYLVFVTMQSGDRDIYLFSVETGRYESLVHTESSFLSLTWCP